MSSSSAPRSRPTTRRDLLLVGVLKGAIFFISDLMRELTVPCEIDFMAISSYGASTDSSGVVRILKDLEINITGRDVLVVEDIIDSGLTLLLRRTLGARKPASLEICALLTKPERREVEVPVRYVGFEIPNRFVIGTGSTSRSGTGTCRTSASCIPISCPAGTDPLQSRFRRLTLARWTGASRGRCYPPMHVNRFFRSALFPLVVIVLLVYLASQTLMPRGDNEQKLTYSQLIDETRKGNVSEVTFRRIASRSAPSSTPARRSRSTTRRRSRGSSTRRCSRPRTSSSTRRAPAPAPGGRC